LKLRNIGGVIIIDFIDMDTRRDQLQLLEHFTSAINGDSARPQIASLTELGLVELTRKRQGQNIYELFGKNSTNSQGQIPLQNITIEDINPTTSTESSVINSTLISGEDIQSLQENSIKKKRVNKAKELDTNIIKDEKKSSIDNSKSISTDITGEDINKDNSNKKNENKLININMNENEEMIYSLMGFDPILILDEPPLYKNYIVNIIRPGAKLAEEETYKIIEKAQQESLDHSNVKNNNKDIIRLKNKKLIEKISSNSEGKEQPEEKDINVDSDEKTNDFISADNISINENNVLNSSESQELNEDLRRKRRRSSASS